MDVNDLIEIKKDNCKYLAGKVTKMADVSDEKHCTNDNVDKLLKTHKRTPYNPPNYLIFYV